MNLTNFARGAVGELFNEHLSRIGENILDVNTEPKAKRKLTLTLEFAPEEDRREVTVHVSTKIGLAPLRRAKTRIFIGRVGQHLRIEEEDSRQGDLFQPTALKPAEASAPVSTTPPSAPPAS